MPKPLIAMIRSLPRRVIKAGIEHLPAGFDMPRHQHLEAYVTVVLAGAYEQVSYAGRLRVGAGDILLQPSLDCHADRMISTGIDVLRIPWTQEYTLGGVFRGAPIDEIRYAVKSEPQKAIPILRRVFGSDFKTAPVIDDWEDLLADRLRGCSPVKVQDFAAEIGLSREAVSRGFRLAYGVSPAVFRGEIRAREAWGRIVATRDSLSRIALDLGFADHPHMTRAVRGLTGAVPIAWRRSHLFKTSFGRHTMVAQ